MIRNLIFWLLFPFVLPQAITVRHKAPRFPGAAGPPNGSAGEGKRLRILAVGDSIIAGVGAKDLSRALVGQTASQLSMRLGCRVRWEARGKIGVNAGQVLRRILPHLACPEADAILLSVGVNDVTGLTRVAVWRRNLEMLLAALHRHAPRAVVAVAGIPPLKGFPLLPQPLRALFGLRGEAFDRVLRKVVSQHPFAVHVPLDFAPHPDHFSADGYHPSEQSYQTFGRMMTDHLADRLIDRLS